MAPERMLEHVVRPSRRPPPFADTCCRPFAAEMPKTHRESRTWKVKSLSTNCPQRLARPPPPEISTHPLPAPGSESVPPALIPAAVRTLAFFFFYLFVLLLPIPTTLASPDRRGFRAALRAAHAVFKNVLSSNKTNFKPRLLFLRSPQHASISAGGLCADGRAFASGAEGQAFQFVSGTGVLLLYFPDSSPAGSLYYKYAEGDTGPPLSFSTCIIVPKIELL